MIELTAPAFSRRFLIHCDADIIELRVSHNPKLTCSMACERFEQYRDRCLSCVT